MAQSDSPSLFQLPWKYISRRSIHEFMRDECMDMAASLTYYAVLSLFPGLLAVISVLGLIGQGVESKEAMLDIVQQFVPGEAAHTATDILTSLSTSSGSTITLIIGIATALWSASAYVGAFGRAMNRVYNVREGRPFYTLKPVLLITTFLLVLGVGTMLIMATLSGDIALQVGMLLGMGETAVLVWEWAKWPVLILLAILMIALLYYATPNVKQPRFRWLSPGAAVAFFVMGVASIGFGLYISYFSKYPNTYGALAGVIVMLLWIWIMNNVLLLGAEIDVEIIRGRQLEKGIDAEAKIQLPLKNDTQIEKLRESTQKFVSEGREIRLEQLHKKPQPTTIANLPPKNTDL